MELLMRVLRRAFWHFCRILPVKKNKIVFVANYGRGYSDNPKYIAEALRRKNAPMEFVWIADDRENAGVPDGFKTAKMNSFKYIYYMSTAGFWVDNARKYWCLKKKNQKYIQTWHGGFGLKQVERDAEAKLEADYVKMAVRDASMTDLMLSNSKTLTKLYRDAFWYEKGEILEAGLPRNDRLFSYTAQDIKRIKECLSLPENAKIALYAPTFRSDKKLTAYNMDYKRLADNLSKRFGGEWIVLLRLHPNVFKLSKNIEFDNKTVFNASSYNDIQELYMISDIALTDYSSVMFDFMLTGKPCLLYASDVEQYRQDRDFFVSIDSLPFPLSQNNDELEKTVADFDNEAYKQKVQSFYDYHGFCDSGKASDAAAYWILKRMS